MNTEVELKLIGSIPRGYIPADMRRMEAYRRISQCKTIEELSKVEEELDNAYGSPPAAVNRLIELAEIRIRAASLNIKSITRHDNDIIITTHNTTAIARSLEHAKGTVRIVAPRRPEHPPEIYYRPPVNYFNDDSILHILRRRLKLAMEHDN